jgi:hypothetical protein
MANPFASDVPSTVKMKITPAAAKLILARAAPNRTLRKTWVHALADVIRRGAWEVTHQGIAFDVNGELRDGQHRLNAIIEADTAVDMMVSKGFPVNSFDAVDQGVLRTLADVYDIPRAVASVCRLVVAILRFPTASKVFPDQIRPLLDSDLGPIVEALTKASSAHRRGISSSSGRLGAALAVLDGEPTAYVLEQYRAATLNDGQTMSARVNSYFNQCARTDNGSVSSDAARVWRAYKAYDYKLRGVSRLQITDQTDAPGKISALIEKRLSITLKDVVGDMDVPQT